MTADQPIDGPAPRRLASPEPALDGDVRPGESIENPPAPRDRPDATVAIATLEAPPVPVIGVPQNPRTGEPRVPRTVTAAAGLSFLAVLNVAVALLWVYWDAVPKENFANASWLMGRFVTEPGSTARVLLAIAVTVIAVLIAVALAITGYYAWAGYRWSRISAVVAAVLSFGALSLNVYAWSTIPLAVAAAVLLWLPPASRFFVAWGARRHPQQVFAPPTVEVYYGPLPRYRTD